MSSRTAPWHADARPFERYPHLMGVASTLMWHAQGADHVQMFLRDTLPTILPGVGGEYVAVVTAQAGEWLVASEAGITRPLPRDLAAEALDNEAIQVDADWVATPLRPHASSCQVLVVRLADGSSVEECRETLACLLPVLRETLDVVESRQNARLRTERLEAVLDIANQWNQTREVEPLLEQMAEAATQLLGADRASIFVWDRRNKQLVGRPAMGVEGGELRVPEDCGVVGRVVQSGEAVRVDEGVDDRMINRQVDSELGYQTRSLLCVPLRGRSGELFGAFELVNKLEGRFTDQDEQALTELAEHAAVALENAQDREKLLRTSQRITSQANDEVRLIGESAAIDAIRSIASRVADTDLAVLILGENGTGKEVVAQSIHLQSRRAEEPFIAVNCAAIPDTLAESELFGHEQGAFTDAKEARLGKFELAAGGTLFLDEIGDLSLGAQAKLLRVLEERVIVRVGGSATIPTEARVLAATNQNLAEMVRERRFREDLYFRLNVVTIELPSLRDRPEDIMPLAEHFMEQFAERAHRRPLEFSDAALQRMQSHAWPGNVRELRNLMERLAYLAQGDTIETQDLAFILSPRGDEQLMTDFSKPLADATEEFQVNYIRRAIDRAAGNVSRAAAQLGLHRSNLYRKMRQLGMDAVKE